MTTRVFNALKRTPTFVVEMCGEMMIIEITPAEFQHNNDGGMFERMIGHKVLMALEMRLRDVHGDEE